MAHPTYTLKLEWSRDVTPAVKHLAFSREDGVIPQYVPGQFVTFHILTAEGKKVHRSFSVANAPTEQGILEMAAAYVEGGIASTLLFNLKPGDTVTAGGPYGLFVLKEEKPKRYVLVATGTGVTPYRSMLLELAKRFNLDPDLSVDLILGVRIKSDALFADDFLAFANRFPQRFRFHVYYSREQSENATASHEAVGHVQDKFTTLNLSPESDIVYLCGNPGMIDTAFAKLTEEFGFDKKSVRREKYSFAH